MNVFLLPKHEKKNKPSSIANSVKLVFLLILVLLATGSLLYF